MMKLSAIKAALAAAVTTLVGYSSVWAQPSTEIIFDCTTNCGGGNNTPQLAAPAVIALIAMGVVAAITMAKRK